MKWNGQILYISKAFGLLIACNCNPKDLTITKLGETYGFQMDAPELTDDFLSIRKQRIKETLSSWKNIAFYFRYTNLQFEPTWLLNIDIWLLKIKISSLRIDIWSYRGDTTIHNVKENKEFVVIH